MFLKMFKKITNAFFVSYIAPDNCGIKAIQRYLGNEPNCEERRKRTGIDRHQKLPFSMPTRGKGGEGRGGEGRGGVGEGRRKTHRDAPPFPLLFAL